MYDFSLMNEDELSRFLMNAIKTGDKTAIFQARAFANKKYLIDSNNESDIKLTVEVIANNCCPECVKYDGVINDIEQEIKSPSLPRKDCTRPKTGCTCCYSARLVFDENDLPVFK